MKNEMRYTLLVNKSRGKGSKNLRELGPIGHELRIIDDLPVVGDAARGTAAVKRRSNNKNRGCYGVGVVGRGSSAVAVCGRRNHFDQPSQILLLPLGGRQGKLRG